MASENGVLAKFVVKNRSEKIGSISVWNLRQKIGHVVDKDFDELVMLEREGL